MGEGQMTSGQAVGPTEDQGDAVATHVCLKPHLILRPWEKLPPDQRGQAICPGSHSQCGVQNLKMSVLAPRSLGWYLIHSCRMNE